MISTIVLTALLIVMDQLNGITSDRVEVKSLPSWIKAAVEIPACVSHARSLLFEYVKCEDVFEHDLLDQQSLPSDLELPLESIECCLKSKFIQCFKSKADEICGKTVADKLTTTLMSNITCSSSKYDYSSRFCKNILNSGETDVILILFICFCIAFFSSILMVTAYFLCLKCSEKYQNLGKIILIPVGLTKDSKKQYYQEI